MTQAEINALLWAGDANALDEAMPCRCCCDEHTFSDCAARLWGGCRSGLPFGDDGDDKRAWAAHYAKHHGLTAEQFYGGAS